MNARDENIDRADSNSKRSVRQLRPPAIGQSSWQFTDNYELSNDHRLHATSRANPHYPRDTSDVALNYNTFLTPPSSRQNEFFKNEGASASSYFQLPSFKNNQYNPYGNPYGTTSANAVTEFTSPTVHTSFDLNDAQSHFKQPGKSPFSPAQQTFFPLVLNNGTPKSPPKVHSLGQTGSPAGDVDSLPENFSYYHIGNGAHIKNDQHRPIGSLHRPQGQTQQPQLQHQPKIPRPQPPIYFLDKPTKILSASTPKSNFVHISTVGGFLNNNPTGYSTFDTNYKKPKTRPATEKYDFVTHRPVYREPPAVHEQNDNAYYKLENTDASPYYNPLLTTQRTTPPPPATSPKTFFKEQPSFANFNLNAHKSPTPLYAYEVTTDDGKSNDNKQKDYILTQTPNIKDLSADKYNRPVTKTPPSDFKQFDIPVQTNKKRPSIIQGPQVGVDFDFNKFVYDIRESQQVAKPSPKYNTFARPIQPNTVVIKPQNKPSYSSVPKTKIETTTSNPDDYYYDVDEEEEEETKPTTAKKPSSSTKDDLTTTFRQTVIPASELTTKSVKTNIINYSQPNSVSSSPAYDSPAYKPKVPKEQEDYYEYEDEDDEENDYKMPPQNVSKFMPMSETAAPRPHLVTTSKPLISSYSPLTTSPTTKKYSSNFNRQYYSKPGADNIPRYLNQSTLRPYTVRTRSKTTNLPVDVPLKATKAPKTHIKLTTPTTTTKAPSTKLQTTSTPKTYTIRTNKNNNSNNENNNGKGHENQEQSNRWKQQLTKAQKSQRPNALKKNLWELDERLPNRYSINKIRKLPFLN